MNSSLDNKSISLIFPGQGCQRLGMAKDFVERYSESKAIFEEASDCLKLDCFKLCFEDEVKLNQTQFLQPAILTAEIAILKATEKILGLKPKYYAGHSMGEYSALVAAGVFSFEDGLRLVNGRNALMENCMHEGTGAMLALIKENILSINLDEILKRNKIEAANINSPHQIVVAGFKDDIAKASSEFSSNYENLRAVDLNLGIAFHTSFMKSVEPELYKYIETFLPRMQIEKSACVLSNLSGELHQPSVLIQAMTEQISNCVQWCKNMTFLAERSDKIFEIGPNKVLSRFFKEAGFKAESIYSARSLERIAKESNGQVG